MKPIQLGKQYKYRTGQPSRLLCVDRNTALPVVSLLPDGALTTHTTSGKYSLGGEDSPLDLIEVVPLWEGEVWIHENGAIRNSGYFSHAEIERMSSGCRFGWRKIKAKQEEPT